MWVHFAAGRYKGALLLLCRGDKEHAWTRPRTAQSQPADLSLPQLHTATRSDETGEREELRERQGQREREERVNATRSGKRKEQAAAEQLAQSIRSLACLLALFCSSDRGTSLQQQHIDR